MTSQPTVTSPRNEASAHASNQFRAGEILEENNAADAAYRIARRKLAVIERLEQATKTKNLFEKTRKKRMLNRWRERNGLNHAPNMVLLRRRGSEDAHQKRQETRKEELEQVRLYLNQHDKTTHKTADQLLRKFNLPAELIEACDEQAARTGQPPNLLERLATEPTDEHGFGASDEQLEAALLWNVEHTDRMAENAAEVGGLVAGYMERVQTAAAPDGGLSEEWATAVPRIQRVVIGDLLMSSFLGYGGQQKLGEYNRQYEELALWPYEDEENADFTAVVDHETTHALGGFSTRWLDEAYTERFRAIVDGQDPNDTDNNPAYGSNRFALQLLYENAPTPLTDKDASAHYLGTDYEANEASLRAMFTEAYGVDVIGILNKAEATAIPTVADSLDPGKRAEANYAVGHAASFLTIALSSLRKGGSPDAIFRWLEKSSEDAEKAELIGRRITHETIQRLTHVTRLTVDVV